LNWFSRIELNGRLVKRLGIGLCLLASQAGQAQASTLADDDVARIAKSAGDQLLERYPFPELAGRYADALSAKVKDGSYRGLDDCGLAKRMTADLRTVHKDVHLQIFCDSQLSKALAPHASTSGQPRMKDLGFEGVDLDMDTSTVYIRSQGGWQANGDTFAAASHAMGLAAQAKYVIIDVRDNPGGSGEMGRFLASYFFADGDEQYYLYGFEKDRERSQQEWTYAYVPGKRLPEAKVYILVNKNTGSAAEGFAYALQRMKRATIVGQTTAGAGIAGEFKPLPHKMSMFLPVKMVVAPHTTTGWEGVGVVPDVSTAPDGEREAAMALIRKDRMAQAAPASGVAR
jgi:retinol-binding protein 3